MKLLSIDCNKAEQELLEQHAFYYGWTLQQASRMEEACDLSSRFRPDLVLLDAETFYLSDRKILSDLRDRCGAPQILLLNREQMEALPREVLLAFDDFLCKPLDLSELSLRVGAALERGQEARVLVCGALRMDQVSKQVTAAGQVVHLTPKEYQLLELLIQVQGRVLSNEEILSRAWPGSPRASAGDVQQYVHHLRRKLKKAVGCEECVQNVKGFGYRLACLECPEYCRK